jgi:tRNA threonylcarbamoyladenosine biosynthesis protein TsaB
MRVLALDTTTREGSLAVVEDDRVIVEQAGDPSRTHAERLPADVTAVLDAAGCALSSIDLFAVASGPGSFTGLRIGIACIQGLAFVTGRRVAPVSALRALAETAAHDLAPGTLVGAWMDAQRRDVFSALYRVGETGGLTARLSEVEQAMVGPPAGVVARWQRESGLPASVAGDGALRYADLWPATTRIVAPPPLASTIARLAIEAARAGETVSPAGVQPVYVRRPDAEVAREAAQSRP